MIHSDKSNYYKCTNCKTIYQWWPNTDTGIFGTKNEFVWDKNKPIQSVRCQRCHTELRLGFSDNTPEYCPKCDQFVMTYGCCPKCGSTEIKELGFFDSV